MFPVLSWFGVIVIVVTVGLVGAVILAALKRMHEAPRRGAGGRSTRRITQPSCGSCHYPVRGLTSLTCPECGSDLREVGIFTPNMNRGGGWRFAAILTWTVLLFLIGSYVTFVIRSAFGPVRWNVSTRCSRQPMSRQYELHVQLKGSRIIWPWQRDNVMTTYPSDSSIVLTAMGKNSGQSLLVLDPQKSQFEMINQGQKMTIEDHWPTLEEVKRWLGAAGVATEPDEVQRECEEIQGLVASYRGPILLDSELTTGGFNWNGITSGSRSSSSSPGSALQGEVLTHFTGTGKSTSSSIAPIEWFSLVVFLFWIFVWALGVRFIWKRW